MAARLIVNGRIVAGTGRFAPVGGWRRGTYDTAHPAPRVQRVDAVDNAGDTATPMTYARTLPEPSLPWTDEDGTVYRVVAKLNLAEGWVGADTIMRWYGVPYATVALWVQAGMLDGALEAGSPSKLYRVRDAAKVLAAAALHKDAKALARKTRKR